MLCRSVASEPLEARRKALSVTKSLQHPLLTEFNVCQLAQEKIFKGTRSLVTNRKRGRA